MKTFLLILLIVCLAVQIPVLIFYFIHKKEIDKKTEEDMRKKFPDWPNVKRPKETDTIYGGTGFFPGMF